MHSTLAGKTAIVTGAGNAQGIGRAIALAFLRRGASVLLTDLPGPFNAGTVLDELGTHAERAAYSPADVTRAEDACLAVAAAVERFGNLTTLVNNAGIGGGSPDFMELTPDDWSRALNVNLLGTANFCQAAIPELRKSDDAAILNIASLSGLKAIPAIPASYTASKFAVVGLTKQLALQLGPENIRVNAICPGSVRTGMMDRVMRNIAAAENISVEEAEALEAQTIALKRAANPAEVGSLAAALAGPGGSYLTGAALDLSGGMHLGL